MKDEFSNFSDTELEEELKKRKNKKKQKFPDELENPNFSNLISCVKDTIKDAVKKDYWDTDNDHYIFEAAMEAIYGKVFWDWFNNRFP